MNEDGSIIQDKLNSFQTLESGPLLASTVVCICIGTKALKLTIKIQLAADFITQIVENSKFKNSTN